MFRKLFATLVVFVASLFGATAHTLVAMPQGDGPLLGATAPVAGMTYTLAGSGINSSASSITLQSLSIPQTGHLIVSGDLSSIFYITLEPGNTKKQEIASCTTVVQNGNGTATISGCSRGLLPFTPYTASTTYAFAHGGGTNVIFSDPPQLFNQYPAKANNEQITGQWGFDQLPTSTTSTPTDQTQLVTVYQLQQATTTGGVNAADLVKGVSQLATGIQAAATTVTGTTGARLVLPASLATSSPQTGGVYVPITQADGTLSDSFITSTLVNGNSTTLHYHSTVLYYSAGAASLSNPTATTTLYQFTIPPNTIVTSTVVTFEMPYSVTASGNDSLWLQVLANSSTIMASTTVLSGTNFDSSNGVARGSIIETGRQNVKTFLNFNFNTSTKYYAAFDYRSSTIDFSTSTRIDITGRANSGGAGLTFTAAGFFMKFDRQ